MDFNLLWLSILNESNRCGTRFDQPEYEKIKCDSDIDFNIRSNCLTYMYKFGVFDILFFKQCLLNFIDGCPRAKGILNKMCVTENLKLCSLSFGPGTDIIGLLDTLHRVHNGMKKSVSFKVIHKYGAWESLLKDICKGNLRSSGRDFNYMTEKLELIQNDFLASMSATAENCLKDADIILMAKPFFSCKTETESVTKKILSILKPGALVFAADSIRKSKYFYHAAVNYGSFLYGPTKVKLENLAFNKEVADAIGMTPVCKGSAKFAVWEKSSTEITNVENKLNILHGQLGIPVLDKTAKASTAQVPEPANGTLGSHTTLHNFGNLNSIDKFCKSNSSSNIMSGNSTVISAASVSRSVKKKVSNVTDSQKSPVDLLLKRCESLISELEEFTRNAPTNSQLKKENCSIRQHCCCRNIMPVDFRNSCNFSCAQQHACSLPSDGHLCGTKNLHFSNSIGNHTSQICPVCSSNSTLARNQGFCNRSDPYIVIPIKNLNTDCLMHLISLSKSNNVVHQ